MKQFIVSIIAVVLSIFAVCYSFYSKPRIAYIEMGTIYEKFKLRKELDVKLQEVENIYGYKLDSVKLIITQLYNELKFIPNPHPLKVDSLQKLEQIYQYNYTQQEEIKKKITEEQNEQIWKRINEYVKDYGRKNKYEFILGANGLGSIMYGADGENITTELVEYLNNEFEGK